MRKLSMALIALSLTACGQGGISFGAQTQVTPGLSSAGQIDLVQRFGAATGTYLGYTSTVTQPTLKFTVAPGSLGVTVTGYTVDILDSAGASFGGVDTGYVKDGLSFRVPSGYVCSGTTSDQCAVANKTAAAREVVFPDTMSFLKRNLADELSNIYYATDICENLSMRLTFRGTDDLNRAWTSQVVTRADVGTTCNRELVDGK